MSIQVIKSPSGLNLWRVMYGNTCIATRDRKYLATELASELKKKYQLN